jgi:hypothetical protein
VNVDIQRSSTSQKSRVVNDDMNGVPRRQHGDHLKLRPNLIWHDGASSTSRDVSLPCVNNDTWMVFPDGSMEIT